MPDEAGRPRPVPVHPVQVQRGGYGYAPSVAPQIVTLAAYEVYVELYGKQEALVTGNCRGGFGIGELVAFLYARSFPRDQWRRRVMEAFDGMKLT